MSREKNIEIVIKNSGILEYELYFDEVDFWKRRLLQKSKKEYDLYVALQYYESVIRGRPAFADRMDAARKQAAKEIAEERMQNQEAGLRKDAGIFLVACSFLAVFADITAELSKKALSDRLNGQVKSNFEDCVKQAGKYKTPAVDIDFVKELAEFNRMQARQASTIGEVEYFKQEVKAYEQIIKEMERDLKKKFTKDEILAMKKKILTGSARNTIYSFFGDVFAEILRFIYGTKNYNLKRDIGRMVSTELGVFLKGILSKIGLSGIVEGVVIAFVIDLVIEVVIKIIGEVADYLRSKFELVETILTFKIYCGVSLDVVGHTISKFDLFDTLEYLFLKLVGFCFQKLGVEDSKLALLISNTEKNNEDSFVNELTEDNSKFSSVGALVVLNDTIVVYDSGNAVYNSSCIKKIIYDPQKRELTAFFNDKKSSVYVYFAVPIEIVNNFMKEPANASSLGAYFNYYFRGHYSYKKFQIRSANKKTENKKNKTIMKIIDKPSGWYVKTAEDLDYYYSDPDRVRTTYIDRFGRVHYVWRCYFDAKTGKMIRYVRGD